MYDFWIKKCRISGRITCSQKVNIPKVPETTSAKQLDSNGRPVVAVKLFFLVTSRSFCSNRRDCKKVSKIAVILNVLALTKAKDREKILGKKASRRTLKALLPCNN